MAAKKTVTVSTKPTNPRPSSAERRAAQIAAISNKQAELKREAAERAAARAASTDAPALPKSSTARRSNAR